MWYKDVDQPETYKYIIKIVPIWEIREISNFLKMIKFVRL